VKQATDSEAVKPEGFTAFEAVARQRLTGKI
jgi:hypothetical protein